MGETFKAACVQNCAGPDMMLNLNHSVEMIKKARDMGADLITLPEFFCCLDVNDAGLQTGSCPEVDHPGIPLLCDTARETGAWVLADSRSRNRSMMIAPDGSINARYDKIHMFDVELGNGESYKESDKFEPGTEAVLAETPWGPLGMTVCYDLRFAYLYRALAQAGAMYLSVPAAFMRTTGQAHWHTLLRARAIETGCYVIAPCQYGTHGRAITYGHSLIVDPWGTVLADGSGEDEDIIIAEIDSSKVDAARRKIPALEHDRPFEGDFEGSLKD